MKAERIAILAGSFSLSMIAGALIFQYFGNLPPCEMCHWQRWPHIAAAMFGLLGGALIVSDRLDRKWAPWLAAATILLILVTGMIGAYQAGVEWRMLPGPSACMGNRVVLTGTINLNEHIVRCDVAAWRLFGISLAGYNALLSFATVLFGALAWRKN
jgi:disulfide bond formation protein DsbB